MSKPDDDLDELKKDLRKIYKQAYEELQDKADDYFDKYADRYQQELEKKNAGKYTDEQFAAWARTQMMRGQKWEEFKNDMAQRLTEVDQNAATYTNDFKYRLMSESYNYSAYQIEQATGASFTLHNEQTIKHIATGKKILPPSSIRLTKDVLENKQKISNAVLQGILQGESPYKIAVRMAEDISGLKYRMAVSFARTAVTSAQNAGRQECYEEAADMGIEIEKEWVATVDGRTRESHAELDGVRVPYDEEFPNGLMFPGDPNGDPEEIMNCRCTVRAIISKYNGAVRSSNIDGHQGIHDTASYEKWKESKVQSGRYWWEDD